MSICTQTLNLPRAEAPKAESGVILSFALNTHFKYNKIKKTIFKNTILSFLNFSLDAMDALYVKTHDSERSGNA